MRWIVTVLIVLAGCSKNPEISGHVMDREGAAVGGVAVRLVAIDDRGTIQSELAHTISNSDGHYSFDLNSYASPSILVQALIPQGSLRGFLAGAETNVNPLTEAVVGSILDITSPDGGRTLTDFSSSALTAIAKTLSGLDPASVNLKDEAAVSTLVLNSIGRALAEASSATRTATSSAGFDPEGVLSDPVYAVTTRCALAPVHELTALNFTFDLTADAKVCDGFSAFAQDGFDLAFAASVLNDTFVEGGTTAFPSVEASSKLQDGRTLVAGPFALTSGVTLLRKIFIPEDANYARFLDVLTNPTAGAQVIDLNISGNLGSDLTTLLFVSGEDGDAIEPTDRYAATFDTTDYDASVGFIWQDNNGLSVSGPQFVGSGNPDLFEWTFSDVSVPSGASKSFLYFTVLSTERETTRFSETLRHLVENPDMREMSTSEIQSLTNFAPNRGNIFGEAGSVVAGSTVTVENRTKGTQVTTRARADWAFFAAINAATGDQISISATDGFATSLVVP